MKITNDPTITIRASSVLGQQLQAVAFTTIELVVARRLTGWRRWAIYLIAGRNIARFVITGRALVAHREQQRATR